MALASGDNLGRYTIERPLGSGAMGEVHLARDPRIDRQVALKTLRLATVRPGEVEAMSVRLLREARAAGRLLHPHIVTLFDAGEQDGLLYLAFEYVPGSDLGVRLRNGPPLALGEALRIARETCEGLGFAHRHGIVHRDVKPSNLLLTADGTVKISDFGIAKLSGESQELTVSGSVMGSPHYLSPEQVRGEPLDGRSDLFSLGIVLYEMIAGRRPFDGETLTTLVYQILHREPPPLPLLRDGLQPAVPHLLSWFLAKDRDLRVPDAKAAAEALAALVASLPDEVRALPAVDFDEGTLILDDPSRGALRTLVGGGSATGEPHLPPPPPPAPPAEGSGIAASAGPGSQAAGSLAVAAPVAPVDGVAGLPPSGSYAVPRPRRRPGAIVAVLSAAVLVAIGLVAGLLVLRSPGGEGSTGSADGLVVDGATSSSAAAEAATAAAPGVVSAEPAAGDRVEATPPPRRSVAARPVAPTREPTGDSAPVRAPVVAESSRPAPTTPAGVVGDRRDRPAAREEGEAAAALAPAAGADREETADPAGPGGRRIGRPRSIGVAEAIDESVASGMRLVLQVQPPDAYVLVNGTVVGQVREFSPQARRTLDLPSVGEHTVVFRRAGMRDRTVRVDARSDGPAITPLVGRLLPLAAAETPLHELESHRVGRAIAFQVRPADAKVLVDGRPVGVASQFPGGRLRRGEWLELTPGVHRVSLVAPGHRQVDLAIDVTSGALEERKRIEVVLLPLPPGGAP